MELIDREKIEWYGCNFETPRCESENRKCSECSHAECSHAQVMQLPSIKAPDNPTNGDMLLTIFNTATVYGIDKENDCIAICIDNNFYQKFRYSWWNASYKGVEE